MPAGLDRDYVRRAGPGPQRGFDPRGHRRGRQPPVQQQHLDQRPRPGPVAELPARLGPQRLVGRGEAAAGPRLRERHRPGQRPRLAGQDLQVMVEHQVLVPGCHQARVHRDRLPAVEDGQLVGGQPDPHRFPDQPGRHRVAALPDADPGEPVGLRPQHRAGVEPVSGQRAQQRRLGREVGRHGVPPELDVPLAVPQVVLGQPGVQVRQRPHPRDRDQEIPAEPPDLALDPALLVSPARCPGSQ